MKLQHLAVIFIIIILPITMVLSQYIDYNLEAVKLRKTYDTKLLDSTYDALKAFQLNSVHNAISDLSTTKIEELEAAVKAFFNSLSTTLGYTGYKSSVMEEYVPAVVFTMYDGYYIYSPYPNTLTAVQDKVLDEYGAATTDPYVDEEYENDKILYGIKPYVHYSVRYCKGNIDVVITYTLDNYITIRGMIGATEYVDKSGYLIDGIKKVSETEYEYDGCSFKKNGTEELKEMLGNNRYSYIKWNGTKYYLDSSGIFYIDKDGEKNYSQAVTTAAKDQWKDIIKNNNSAYLYYKNAYEFTKFVRDTFSSLLASEAVDENGSQIFSSEDYKIFGDDNVDNITGIESNGYIQDSDSAFNKQRAAVIRYTIEKNLEPAISGYKNYSEATGVEFIMPKISEMDWAAIQNNVCIATFLQGFKVGQKEYNKYCVIANNLTKEYIDENDIYMLQNNGIYCQVTDKNLNDDNLEGEGTLGYQPGIWKLNFEKKTYKKIIDDSSGDKDNYETVFYYPINNYIGSYRSIVQRDLINNNETQQDLYKYMRELTDKDNVKLAYYTALARERYGAYFERNEIDSVPWE